MPTHDGRRSKLRILSPFEKLAMAGRTFEHTDLARVDFSLANLRFSRFLHVSLQGSDFRLADLRGAHFIGCDLRGALFHQTRLGDNRFDESWFVGARGLSTAQEQSVRQCGGRFLDLATETPRSPPPR
jgi:uncharacterized protein YjbI with pentapeptide repeats